MGFGSDWRGVEPFNRVGAGKSVSSVLLTTEGTSGTGSATFLSVAAEYSVLVFAGNCCTSVEGCCTTVGGCCAALASPAAKTKANKDKTSATTRARGFRLSGAKWIAVLCDCPMYKSLCASYLSLVSSLLPEGRGLGGNVSSSSCYYSLLLALP